MAPKSVAPGPGLGNADLPRKAKIQAAESMLVRRDVDGLVGARQRTVLGAWVAVSG